mgnify:CR=1 FL=1
MLLVYYIGTMKFAIIQTGGKQYKVKEGASLKVEKLEASHGQQVIFDKVLLTFDEKEGLTLGKPYIANLNVYGQVIEQGKGAKIIIFKYKPKKRERKKTGHRQTYTLVKITSIGEQKATKAAPKVK